MSPNFNNLRKQVCAEDYFKGFKFDWLSASTTHYRQRDFVYS